MRLTRIGIGVLGCAGVCGCYAEGDERKGTFYLSVLSF